MSGGACGGACAFFHLNTKDSVDPLFIYMVWPPRETPFVCAGACSFFHLNEKYSVDYLFFYMVWEPRATPPFARAHLLNVGHGRIHANGTYHIIILTRGRKPRRVRRCVRWCVCILSFKYQGWRRLSIYLYGFATPGDPLCVRWCAFVLSFK